jgi:low affinity Fe/Cu permease
MHQKMKEEILKNLIQLAENKMDPSDLGADASKVVISEGIGFALDDQLSALFFDTSKYFIQDAVWGKKFSEKYINNKLDSILIKITRDGNLVNAKNYLDELVKELDSYSTEFIVYVPLDGIKMTTAKMQIGKVILKNMDNESISELTTRIEQIILSTRNTPNEKEHFIKSDNKMIDKYICNNICAEYRIIAEPDKAREMAEDEARRVIDLFRYAIPAMYGSSQKVTIGIKGDINSAIRYIPIISSGQGGYYPRSYLRIPIYPR